MDFIEQQNNLIDRGNNLLGLVKTKDIGEDIIFNVLDNEHIEELKKWHIDIEEFVEKYGLEVHKMRLFSNSWIINQDERVSVERIKAIISILKQINA